jgi:hypothetical protein
VSTFGTGFEILDFDLACEVLSADFSTSFLGLKSGRGYFAGVVSFSIIDVLDRIRMASTLLAYTISYTTDQSFCFGIS